MSLEIGSSAESKSAPSHPQKGAQQCGSPSAGMPAKAQLLLLDLLSAVCRGVSTPGTSRLVWPRSPRSRRAEASGAREHLAAAGTLGFKHFKLSASSALHPGANLGPVRRARQPVPSPRPAPRALFGSSTPQPGCLFLPLWGCESLRSLVSVAAFEGIYKPRSSPLCLL